MYPRSVAEIKAAIENRFLRNTSQFLDTVDDVIEDWIRNLADTYPYWFLTIYPGKELLTGFPYSSLSSITTLAGNWVDAGWLVTEPGVATYDVYHPLETDEAADADWWQPCKVQMIDYVHEFTAAGLFNGSLPIPEYESGLVMSTFNSSSRPRLAMWSNTETVAQITFNPTPDRAYLYAIQYSIKDPPLYQDGTDPDTSQPIIRNRFITGAPEAVTLYGLIQAARFHGEASMKQDFMTDLYGANPQDYGAQAPNGGLLGKLKKDTIRKARQAREVMEQWSSITAAQGRIPAGISEKTMIWGRRGSRWW